MRRAARVARRAARAARRARAATPPKMALTQRAVSEICVLCVKLYAVTLLAHGVSVRRLLAFYRNFATVALLAFYAQTAQLLGYPDPKPEAEQNDVSFQIESLIESQDLSYSRRDSRFHTRTLQHNAHTPARSATISHTSARPAFTCNMWHTHTRARPHAAQL